MKPLSPWALFLILCCALLALTACGQPPTNIPDAQETTPTPINTEPPAAEPPSTLPMGESCTTSLECTSKRCMEPDGLGATVCTQGCRTNKDCPGGFVCEAHSAAPGLCIPTCQTDADCSPFPDMPACNVEGHCWRAWKPAGTPCTADAACFSGVCQQTPNTKTKTCQ